MLVPFSRRRIVQRLQSHALRFVYIAAQPGSGVSTLLRHFIAQRPPSSISFMPEIDRLSPAEFAEYLRLMGRPQAGRLLVATASDPSFPQPFTDARPGELCIITDEDLALTPEEIAQFFEANGVALCPQDARKVYDLTGGWAAGTSYALRLWDVEGEQTACDPCARSYHGMRVFVYERILSTLSPDELAALVTTVAIQESGSDVLHHVLPATNIEVALASLTQRRLLLRENGTVTVPGLVGQSVREHYNGDIGTLGAQIAQQLAESGNSFEAARVSFSAGSTQRGVEYLLAVPLEQLLARRNEFRRMSASLSDGIICSHPKLWYATLHWRRYRIDLRVLIAEGQLLLETFHEGEDPGMAQLIKSALSLGFFEAGEFEQAQALERELSALREDGSVSGLVAATIAANNAAALSLQARVVEAARELNAASALLARSPMLLSLFMSIHVRKARLEGDWFAEKAFHERAIAAGEAGGDETTLAMALIEAAFGALMAGDRCLVERFVTRMREMGEPLDLAAFAAFARIGQGTRMDAETRFGLPRLRGIAHIFHAASSGSANEARAHLTAAIDEFDNSGYLFGRILARVALAQVVPRRQVELIGQAKVIAKELNSLAIRGALSHLEIGELPAHNQPLRHFADQMRRFREPSSAPLTVSVLRGVIERDGRILDVSPKVFLLLSALNTRRRPLDREELCEMLWPDAEPQDAANALKMTVRRARLQCGDPNVVRWANSRYVLGDDVHVDLDEVRHLCEGALKDPEALANRRSELLEVYKILAQGRKTSLLEHEWFVGTEALLTRLQMELGEALARDSIARADFTNAGELSALMVQCDPCDETAWELTIRMHLAAGQRELAARALREYRRVAAAQLESVPSAHLEKLFA